MFEDDHYRYLWDGFVTANGFNPYTEVPAHFFDRALSSDIEVVLDAVSYPDIGSVYGAIAQYVFALCYILAPGELWPLKGVIFTVECILLLLLYRNLPLSRFTLLAFCPLLVHSFSINLHVDILALLLAYIAMQLVPKRAWLAGILLALACSIKLYAILLLPLIVITALPRSASIIKSCIRGIGSAALCSFVVTFLLIETPYLVSGGFALANIAQAGKVWAFNSPFFYLGYDLWGGYWTRSIMLLCFAAWSLVVLYFYWKRRFAIMHKEDSTIDDAGGLTKAPTMLRPKYSIYSAAFMLFSGFIIFSPVVNPWYFAWVLLFAALGSRQWWPWCAAVSLWLSYLTGINTGFPELGLYQVPSLVLALEWALPLAFFCWFWRHNREKTPLDRPENVPACRNFGE